jgi:tryptophan-rich hypothetical protein
MANKPKFPYLLGSKWTAKQKTWGWRHFQVVNRRNEGKWVFAELVASCDPNTRFWINAKQLKDPELWEAGWKTIAEMASPDPEDGIFVN